MSLSVAGARTSTSLLPSAFAASSSRPRLLALPLHRRSHGSLASPPAAGRRLLRVRMARTESTGVGIGFRAPEFEVCPSVWHRLLAEVLIKIWF